LKSRCQSNDDGLHSVNGDALQPNSRLASWRSGRARWPRGARVLPSPPRREPRRGDEHRAATSTPLTRAHSLLPSSRSGRAHRGGNRDAIAAVAISELAHSPPLAKPRPSLRLPVLHLLDPSLGWIEPELSRIAVSTHSQKLTGALPYAGHRGQHHTVVLRLPSPTFPPPCPM
jgi:hypothetical protein